MESAARFHLPVVEYARTDFPLLREAMVAEGALALIREHGIGERIIYFYVVDDDDRLVGVLPTRRLLTASLDARLGDIMVRRVVAIPRTATLLDACDLFVMHKFFALPVVDEERRVVGIVDLGVFTQEMLDVGEPEPTDEVFEALGFRLSELRGASLVKAFRVRFPWLLATIASGTAGALLAGIFEATLARAIVVSFFLALVLALAESVSVQSMTLTLQALRTIKPTFAWFWKTVGRELRSGALIGLGCGAVVCAIVWLWRGNALAAVTIGSSIVGSVMISNFAGVLVPAILHALKLDPKIAAGPLTLAVADVLTLLLYFSLASWLL
jgi:magnesium transporter